MKRLPWNQLHFRNILFLMGTFLTAITAVPIYLWQHGLNLFQLGLFLFFFVATGLSITLGYHRLFSHLTFKAAWPVRLFTLLFGAAAFENSALAWCADHRRHHKFVDHDEDPYDISKGFFYAHIGWILFRRAPETPLTWVRDLQKDRLVVWQHRYYLLISAATGFLLPALIGYAVGGANEALGAFLIAGVARVVCVHHMTFCINSLCHTIGKQPYSSRCSARDSVWMALFTFGEGYHNYHHEFQHDYRNGVKPWQWDPTKWAIWLLSKIGMVRHLRTVSREVVLRATFAEQQRQLAKKLSELPFADSLRGSLDAAHEHLQEALKQWETLKAECNEMLETKDNPLSHPVVNG